MSNEQDTDLAWRIMEAAGGTRIRVEEYAPGYYLVASREHGAGVTSPKEDAFDTVQEVALHLVSQQAVARAREQEKASRDQAAAMEAANEVSNTAEIDAIIAANSAPARSTDAGEREMGDGPAGDAVSAGDAGSGDDGGADADGGDVGSESGESGVALSGVEDAEAIDAEFEEPAAEGADFPEVEEQIEPELIRIENDPNDIPVMEPEAGDPGGVVYFGDNIHTIRLAKMGRLAQIARALKDVLQEGWSLEEFRSLQNWVVRADRGEAPDDPVARARFEAISERSRAMSRIDAYKDLRELELDSLDREGVEAFDVDWGWPE